MNFTSSPSVYDYAASGSLDMIEKLFVAANVIRYRSPVVIRRLVKIAARNGRQNVLDWLVESGFIAPNRNRETLISFCEPEKFVLYNGFDTKKPLKRYFWFVDLYPAIQHGNLRVLEMLKLTPNFDGYLTCIAGEYHGTFKSAAGVKFLHDAGVMDTIEWTCKNLRSVDAMKAVKELGGKITPLTGRDIMDLYVDYNHTDNLIWFCNNADVPAKFTGATAEDIHKRVYDYSRGCGYHVISNMPPKNIMALMTRDDVHSHIHALVRVANTRRCSEILEWMMKMGVTVDQIIGADAVKERHDWVKSADLRARMDELYYKSSDNDAAEIAAMKFATVISSRRSGYGAQNAAEIEAYCAAMVSADRLHTLFMDTRDIKSLIIIGRWDVAARVLENIDVATRD